LVRIAKADAAGVQHAEAREQRLVALERVHQPRAVAVEVDRAAEDLAQADAEIGEELRLGHLAALEREQRRLVRALGGHALRRAELVGRHADVRVRAREGVQERRRQHAAEIAHHGAQRPGAVDALAHARRMTS
jgi:hypothetical protein